MTQSSEYHGGLVFPGDAQNALAVCSSIVEETLGDYGHTVEHTVPVSAHAAELHSAGYCVRLSLDQPPGTDRPAQHLSLSLSPSFSSFDGRETSELLLAVVLYRLVQSNSATQIYWQECPDPLSRRQFLSAFADAAPQPAVRPRRPAQDFRPVDDTLDGISRRCDTIMGRPAYDGALGLVEMSEEECLALAFRTEPHPDEVSALEDEPENSKLRLASWAMTGVVASVSMPVAVSLAAVNLLKGENFRLNTQVLSFSAFVAFTHSASTASAMTFFGG